MELIIVVRQLERMRDDLQAALRHKIWSPERDKVGQLAGGDGGGLRKSLEHGVELVSVPAQKDGNLGSASTQP